MQMESEVADLLDRRMMSLFGMSSHKNPNKVDVQNTSKKLQNSQRRSPEPRDPTLDLNYANDTVGTENIKARASVTIGLDPNGTHSSIERLNATDI